MQIIGNYLSSLAKCMQSNSRVLKMSVTGLKGGPRCRGAATVTAGNGMSLIPGTFQHFEFMEAKLLLSHRRAQTCHLHWRDHRILLSLLDGRVDQHGRIGKGNHYGHDPRRALRHGAALHHIAEAVHRGLLQVALDMTGHAAAVSVEDANKVLFLALQAIHMHAKHQLLLSDKTQQVFFGRTPLTGSNTLLSACSFSKVGTEECCRGKRGVATDRTQNLPIIPYSTV